MITFDLGIKELIKSVLGVLPSIRPDSMRIVRDMQGKLFLVVQDDLPEPDLLKINQRLRESLGCYLGSQEPAVRASDTLTGNDIFSEPWIIQNVNGFSAHLIERRAMGEDWVLRPEPAKTDAPPRFVFFSLKGGVGRSTALSLWAHHLSERGKTLLVVDMDLEAPGLGAQLLERKGKPKFGVVDWLVEDLAGNDVARLLPDMARGSPIVPAGLHVVPAFGTQSEEFPENVIAKLARAYLDKDDAQEGHQNFSGRLRRMLSGLESYYRPDVVLIDSRAGLHETVAASLLHLDAEVLCFATNLDVSWQGYRYLFAHLAQLAQVTAQTELDWRERFKMVSARATPGNTASFVGNSYALWSETLYEESSEPGDAFSYDERDDSAPHYPLVIPRSDTFESFTPYSDIVEMQDMQISGVFGSFFRGLDERLEMIKHG